MAESLLDEKEHVSSRRGSGIGVKNVNERIRLYFGDLLVLDHPHDDIQRIVEKMRVNLGLQGIKLAPTLRFVFRTGLKPGKR